jgi:hypothetical protein
VATQTIAGAFTDDIPGNYDFYKWNEPTKEWLNQKVGTNNIINFVPGSGYLAAYAATETKSFIGVLNAANVTAANLTKTGTSYSGWNLLGNPFASALKWNDGTNWSVPATFTGTAKIWDEATAQYVDIAPNSYIPAMNGFMVEVLSGSPASLTIPSTARVHNTTPWYKSSEGLIKLIVHDPDTRTAQESIIKVSESATEDYDSQYDSHFLSGYAPKFYSNTGSEKLSTNTLPLIDNSCVIAMGFEKNAAGNFSIELAENSISDVSSVFLTDKKTGTVTELSKTPVYNFSAAEGDDINRFELNFATTYGIYSEVSSEMQVYVYDKSLVINQVEAKSGDIWIYNITGQLLRSQKLELSSSQSVNIQNFAPGVYMVSIRTAKGLYNQKVVVK